MLQKTHKSHIVTLATTSLITVSLSVSIKGKLPSLSPTTQEATINIPIVCAITSYC